ncbi:polysaccharide biosynthesis tyrosine autokinase [Halobacillus salinus]|uniref:non-specific protein-tyrosine kinase n=1 Tax=Halobacillus salinus TaxID=192814 RepID=A0A4Z0GXY0_9BACI|nr:polysaccharide biosynthesis tyrosine autokinase [Halobacillus salinus]
MELNKDQIDLRDFLEAIKKNILYIFLGTLIATFLSAFITYSYMKPVYEAEALLIVHEIPKKDQKLETSDIDAQLKLIPTYKEMMESPMVMDAAGSEAGMTGGELKKHIYISADPSNQILSIRAESNDPRNAAFLANLVAYTAKEEIQSFLTISNISTLSRAEASEEPIRPKPFLNIGIAFILSLFSGCLVVCMSRFFFAKFRSSNEIQSALKVPILGRGLKVNTKPYTLYRSKHDLDESWDTHPLYRKLVARWANTSKPKEGYRKLKTNLVLLNKTKEARAIVITGSTRKDGSTLTSGNLAVSLAQSGKRTVYVDANLYTPAGHLMFNSSNRVGLSSYLAGDSNLDRITQSTFHSNLDILTIGRDIAERADYFTLSQVTALIQDLKRKYEYVIIDCAPTEISADTNLFANQADGCVYVVNYKEGKLSQTLSSFNQLKESGATILGTFVNWYKP